ncbi:hypothetical protein BDZ91DRAFT_722573 [Kalaharituber pfeilii]|nr:hypothetical protein BDZ91DRAFT_722573 [Kalaharituber pfeilii]
MKLSVLALVASVAMAAALKGKTYLVTFPADTPQSEVDRAARDIEANGGTINHRYTLLKGFSVVASEDAMNTFKAQGKDKYPMYVEEDQVVHIMNDPSR